MPAENPITINALTLDRDTLTKLSAARFRGYFDNNPRLDSLADAGAQLILSFGAELVTQVYPDGLMFEIRESDLVQMRAILEVVQP